KSSAASPRKTSPVAPITPTGTSTTLQTACWAGLVIDKPARTINVVRILGAIGNLRHERYRRERTDYSKGMVDSCLTRSKLARGRPELTARLSSTIERAHLPPRNDLGDKTWSQNGRRLQGFQRWFSVR